MKPSAEKTTLVLANACALASEVMIELAGADMAETLNGSFVTRRVMSDLVASEIAKKYQDILMLPVAA